MRAISFLKKRWVFFICYVFFVLFIIGIFLFLYKDLVAPSRHMPRVLVSKEVGERKIIIKNDEKYEQEFSPTVGYGEGIGIAFDADETDSDSIVEVALYDKANELIGEWSISKQEFSGYNSFMLAHADLEKGEKYVLELELSQGNQAAVYEADEGNECIAYQILGGTTNSLFYFVLLLFILIIIFLILSSIVVMRRVRIEQAFLILSLVLGIIYMILIPPYFTPDEEYHFAASYAQSSRVLGEKPVDDEGYVLVRKTDYDYYISYIESGGNILSSQSYIAEFDGLVKNTDTTLGSQYRIRTLPDKTGLVYIPQTVGIIIARIFDLNGAWLFMCGRAMSLLVYVLLMYVAIRFMPIAKMLMAVIGLLPMTIELAASYNYDAILLPLCFFCIAYILKLAYDAKEVRYRDFVFLAMLLCGICLVKYIYAAIFMLGLLIPTEKFGSKKKKSVMALGLITVGIIMVILVSSPLLKNIVYIANPEPSSWSGQPEYSFEHIWKDPLHILGVFFRTFQRNADYYIGGMIGRTLGWLNISITPLTFSAYIVLLVGCILKTNTTSPLKKMDRFCFLICGIIITGLIYVSLLVSWTREASVLVEGVQGRYFLPILPLLCGLQNNLIIIQRKIDYELLTALSFVSVFSIIDIVQSAIIR